MTTAAEIYDNMDENARDMPRHEFIKRFNAATDQQKMQRDLGQILHGRREQATIDLALRRGRKRHE
jgi:hypothetical protein